MRTMAKLPAIIDNTSKLQQKSLNDTKGLLSLLLLYYSITNVLIGLKQLLD